MEMVPSSPADEGSTRNRRPLSGLCSAWEKVVHTSIRHDFAWALRCGASDWEPPNRPAPLCLEMQRMAARQSRATTSLKPQLFPLSFTGHKSGSTYGSAHHHRQSTAWPFELGSSSEDPAWRAEWFRSFAPSSFRFSQAQPLRRGPAGTLSFS